MIDRNEFADPADVLLVDPSGTAAGPVRDGLAEAGANAELSVVERGRDALAFHEGRDPYADAPDPCLVLVRTETTDPGADALEFLETIREEPSTGEVPVVVLVESPADQFVAAAYHRGANAVVPVPVDDDAVVETIAGIVRFWLSTARLPNRADRR